MRSPKTTSAEAGTRRRLLNKAMVNGVPMSAKIAAHASRVNLKPDLCGGGLNGARKTSDGAVVVTFTVTGAAFLPSNGTTLGETVQVASEGAPEHAIDADWLKPPCGVTIKL